MYSRKNIDGTAIGVIIIVSLMWDLQQILVKAVALAMAPIMQIALSLHFKIDSEQLKPIQWIGIITSFLGIALTLLWQIFTLTRNCSKVSLSWVNYPQVQTKL